MTPAQAFLAAVRDTPDDDAPRLVFSDWLDDHGDEPRAELIRLQCELARGVKAAKRRDALRRRERELLLAHELEWVGPLRTVARRATFTRGFVERVTVHADRLAEAAAALVTLPLRHLVLLGSDNLKEVVGRPELERVTTLDLREGKGITDKGIRAFANAPHLQTVTHLILRQAGMTVAAFTALAKTPALARLRTLDLYDVVSGGGGKPVPVASLAVSPNLAGLTTLVLGGSPLGDDGAAALVAPGCRLTALRRLHLSFSSIGDAGARALAKADHLSGLECLDLTGNEIGGVAAHALRAKFGDRVRL